MVSNLVEVTEWRKLFDCALRIKALAPWDWMSENDIFGVKNPESEETGYVSVMGEAGEHFAVALYLGQRALYDFFELQFDTEQKQYQYPERLLEIPQIQASFEDRQDLDAWDYQLIKKVKLQFRGKKAWPKFQSYRPGYFPWRLDPSEVRFMLYALEQVHEVALKFKQDPKLLDFEDDFSFFVRMPLRRRDGSLAWQDQVTRVSFPEPDPIPIEWDPAVTAGLKRLAKSNHVLELDFFLFPASIGEKGERPKCTYMLLMLHVQSNLIVGAEPMTVESSLEMMWGQIPARLIVYLANNKIRPKEIRVRSDLLNHILQPVKDELGFKLTQQRYLKKLDAAKAEMLAFFE